MANNTLVYGFIGLADLYAQRVQSVGVERVFDAIRVSLAEYTRVANELLGVMAQRTTVAQEQIELSGIGTLQPLDEWGNPKPVQPSGSYQVAYPIQGGGTAYGTNRVSREMLTIEEAAKQTMEGMQKDKDWLIRHALAAVFTNTTWTFKDQVGANGSRGLGDITIQPLANGDTVTYGRKGGVAPATDTHYLAQAASIADNANPFPTLKAELDEHPSNAGPYVAYVASDLVNTITALTEFVEAKDPDIALGSGSDTVMGGSELVGFGTELLGKTKSGMWVVEAPVLPANYLIAVATGADPVLRMREYPASALQGLFLETHSADGNLEESRMIRYAGFGVRNRVGAVAMRIGNASYAIPSGYTAPLAV